MLSKKIKSLKPSMTLQLSEIAKKLKSEGEDVISLSVGEPDWNTFDNIVKECFEAVNQGFTKYVASSGIPELKKAIVEDTNSYLKTQYKTQNVTVTSGAKFSIFSALQSLINDGDEVIIPSPYWVSYPEMVKLAGGNPVIVNTKPEDRFKLTKKQFENSITDKTKLVMLNSPSNPTGEVYSLSELSGLAEVLKKHRNIILLSDDIYNKLVFDKTIAPHILQAEPSLVDQVVSINGMSKAYSMTGWRIGWALGCEPIIKAMTTFQSQSVSCAVSFCQKASVEALKNSAGKIQEAVKVLKHRRDLAIQLISKIKNLTVRSPGGAFYLWIDVSKYFNEKMPTSKSICESLLDKEKVVVVPGEAFGCQGFVRMSYAVEEKKLKEAISRMSNFFNLF